MALLVRNLAVGLDDDDEALRAKAAKRLRVPADAIRNCTVVRRAIDAREKTDIRLVYAVEVTLAGGAKEDRRVLQGVRRQDVTLLQPPAVETLVHGTEPMPERPVIIGFGPAGMFAALWLAREGYRPLVLERGQGVKTRHRDILQRFYREHDFDAESNLLFGEGGAGAYSDGKLYTRVNDPHMRQILDVFVERGGKSDILVDARPHLGSDYIPTLCWRIREEIIALGGEIRFGSRLDRLELRDGRVESIRVNNETIRPGPLLLGIGHSARDTIRMLVGAGVRVSAKPFQLGVRVEHPQSLVDRWQYGGLCGHRRLPPAEYHLVSKGAGGDLGDVYSFCMCPGGTILPTNESPQLVATNGASREARNGPFANSGLVLTISPAEIHDDPIEGLTYLERLEQRAFELTGGDYRVPAQRAADFLADRDSDGALETSYPFGGRWTPIREILPGSVIAGVQRALADLARRMPGFAGSDCLVTGPESRASAPVRFERDHLTRESVSAAGLYPIGEGAGYAGGIMSAAADGITTAEAIIRRFAPVV